MPRPPVVVAINLATFMQYEGVTPVGGAPGAVDAVNALQRHGCRVIVVTPMTFGAVSEALSVQHEPRLGAGIGIDRNFDLDEVVANVGDVVGELKSRGVAMYVGHTAQDVQLAKAAAAYAVVIGGRTRAAERADTALRGLADLPVWLAEQAAGPTPVEAHASSSHPTSDQVRRVAPRVSSVAAL